MELVQVEILGTVHTNRYGTLVTGDMLRTDAAYAKHLVEEAFAAKYVEAAVPEELKATPITRATRKKTPPTAPQPGDDAQKQADMLAAAAEAQARLDAEAQAAAAGQTAQAATQTAAKNAD